MPLLEPIRKSKLRKPKLYKGSHHQRYKWCVGIGRGNPPFQQFNNWTDALNYAIWWFANKNIMPLG